MKKVNWSDIKMDLKTIDYNEDLYDIIKEIWTVDTPKEFPQSGFQWGCVYLNREVQ